MTEYRKDQAVKIWIGPPYGSACKWREAKIIGRSKMEPGKWKVMFENGDGAIVRPEDITLLTPPHRE
jgi:hypothetical protein